VPSRSFCTADRAFYLTQVNSLIALSQSKRRYGFELNTCAKFRHKSNGVFDVEEDILSATLTHPHPRIYVIGTIFSVLHKNLPYTFLSAFPAASAVTTLPFPAFVTVDHSPYNKN